jgi:GNAT superfamily N-acetyltransferase
MTADIRPATIDDTEALQALYGALNPADPPLSPSAARATFAAMLSHPGLTVLTAFADGVLVASCTLVVIPNLTRGGAPYALIENVVTHADFRRNGHGRAVVRHAVEMAFAVGYYKVMLLTGRTDAGVHRFYQDCGFSQSKTGFEVRAVT